MIAYILLALCAAPTGHTAERKPGPELPRDVASFKQRRDLCDHFRGEEPYDPERRKFLEKRLNQYCRRTDNELASLKAKYKHNDAVMKILGQYEEKIEAGE